MKKFVMMIGLPASGKDTYLDEIVKRNEYVVSTDIIRQEIFKDVKDQSHNKEVFEIALNSCIGLLKKENVETVYFNATNINRKKRTAFVRNIKDKIKGEIHFKAVFVNTPFKKCLERNEDRSRVVPIQVIQHMYKSFQPPWYTEGFDEIEILHKDIYGYEKLNSIVNLACAIPHDNPHHVRGIGTHMLEAKYRAGNMLIDSNFSENERKNILEAINYHDIGKLYTKDFHNIKGEPTKEAHYYCHTNVGSYDYLCYSDNILVANLIYCHMDSFSGYNYAKKWYSERFIHMLKLIHKADIIAA